MLLGEKRDVQVNIEGVDISTNMVVTESKNYNIILENEWLSKVRARLDYKEKLLTISTDQGDITTPVICWNPIRNLIQLHPIVQKPNINHIQELELEDKDN